LAREAQRITSNKVTTVKRELAVLKEKQRLTALAQNLAKQLESLVLNKRDLAEGNRLLEDEHRRLLGDQQRFY
jgi:hypothetical protein